MNPYFASLAERGAGADVPVAEPARAAEPMALETLQEAPDRANAPFEEVERWSEAGPEPMAPALKTRATPAVAADSAITYDAASQQAATTSAAPASGLPRTETAPTQTRAPSAKQTARAAEPRRSQANTSPASPATAQPPRAAPPQSPATPAAGGADEYLEIHVHAEPAAVSAPDSPPAPAAAMRVLPVLAQSMPVPVPMPVRDAAPSASPAPLAATAHQDSATPIATSPRTREPAATARPRDDVPLHIESRSNAPAQWQIHIGRIELEISAAPPAFAPTPAPVASAIAPPRPAFNPRRHYLRSG